MRRVGDREQRLVVAVDVVRAGVDLVRDPRVDLAIFVEDAFRSDQAGRVEERVAATADRFRSSTRSECRCRAPAPCARGGPCARWGSAPPACREARETVGKTGAACANSGKTINRTGRNGALPATAASIIASMRSVLSAHAVAVQRIREVGLARGGRVADVASSPGVRSDRRSNSSGGIASRHDARVVPTQVRRGKRRLQPRRRLRRRIRILRHAVKGQRLELVRARRVQIHLLAEPVGVEQKRARPAWRERRQPSTRRTTARSRRRLAPTTNRSSVCRASSRTSPSRV